VSSAIIQTVSAAEAANINIHAGLPRVASVQLPFSGRLNRAKKYALFIT
jgi:hypothetical protein